MIDNAVDYGVIITEALPKNFKGIEYRHEGKICIIPMDLKSLEIVVNALRITTIETSKARKIVNLSNTKQGELYQRLVNPQLGMKIRNFLSKFLIQQKQIDDDFKSHNKSSNDRQKLLNDTKKDIYNIFSEMSGSDNKLAGNLLDLDLNNSSEDKVNYTKLIKNR